MDYLKSLLKRNKIVKKYRVEKWKRFSRRMMFSAEEVAYLENAPEQIGAKIYLHIKSNSNVSDDIMADLDRLLATSYLADTGAITDALKTDMLFWWFAYGFSFNEYLCYRFLEKTKAERLKFFSDRDSVAFGYDMNDINDMAVFGDKMNTYNKFRPFFGREAVSLASRSDYDVYAEYIAKHRQFVKKNVYKACGQSVELIDISADRRSEKELFDYLISEGKVILEEVVEQGKQTAIFNTSSVNTIRCITLKTRTEMLVPYCFMRTGRKGSFIDNGRSGGLFVGIDPQTGILGTDGVDENGIRYTAHPDSKVQFKGYQLPDWNSAISMCIKMAEEVSSVRMIGWDIAYTDQGWIVIEGNALTEVIGPQCTWLRGIRDDIERFYKLV